jgi:glutathione synthase/RimK-type ligase-like ATP-grasp enzyme
MILNPVPHPATDDGAAMLGLAPLLRMACAGVDLRPLRADLIARAERDLTDVNTLLDLSTVLQLTFDREDALEVQAGALAQRQLYRIARAGGPARLRLLAVKGPGDLMANTPLECLLEGSDVALTILYVGPGLPFPDSVPEHDALFVAVGENDRNRPLLEQIDVFTRSWPRPVINQPARILSTSRDAACGVLAGAPGVAMPVTRRVSRSHLDAVGRDEHPLGAILDEGAFPIIIRPAGSHAGQGLVKADDPNAVASYLRQQSGAEFYVTPFVDYRGRDGRFRKYRIVLIDGRPFVCHVGISDHWMIHYVNAGMAESAEKRAEEARIMTGFDRDFASRHDPAFRAINARVRLDYLGIDCGETPDGRLLVFEVDNAMVVHDMDPVEVFPYKAPQMKRIFAGFRAMLARVADGAATHHVSSESPATVP